MPDSRDVRKAIASEIWPNLRERGFAQIEGRVARRTHADRIDIVEFITFNSYEMERLKLKPGSFAIALGCHLNYVTNPIANDSGENVLLTKPSISECVLRGSLLRPYPKPEGLDRDCWPVGIDGVSIEQVMSGARDAVLGDGMRWFEQFETPEAVFELVGERAEDMSRLWGFGRPGSPVRHFILGYAALAAGNPQAARKHLQKALDAGCFPNHAPRMRADAGLP
jgi:hypothetical protein